LFYIQSVDNGSDNNLVWERAKMKQIIRFFCVLGLFFATPAFGDSQDSRAEAASDWRVSHSSNSRIVAGRTALAAKSDILLGLHIRLDEGWKTYWRSPGDAGVPPEFDWSGSDNVESVEILWPRAVPFDSFGFRTWGYISEVVLPLRVTVQDPARPLRMSLKVFYGVCKDICIPLDERFSLAVPPGPAVPSSHAALIGQFVAAVPAAVGENAPVTELQARWLSDNRLQIDAVNGTGFQNPHLVIEGGNGVLFESAASQLAGDGRHARFTVTTDGSFPRKERAKQRLTVTILDDGYAAEGIVFLQ
jgi:suppressor for copper-sensitivity B